MFSLPETESPASLRTSDQRVDNDDDDVPAQVFAAPFRAQVTLLTGQCAVPRLAVAAAAGVPYEVVEALFTPEPAITIERRWARRLFDADQPAIRRLLRTPGDPADLATSLRQLASLGWTRRDMVGHLGISHCYLERVLTGARPRCTALLVMMGRAASPTWLPDDAPR